jgi:hypothetical protein
VPEDIKCRSRSRIRDMCKTTKKKLKIITATLIPLTKMLLLKLHHSRRDLKRRQQAGLEP